jgi:hypothetical protein
MCAVTGPQLVPQVCIPPRDIHARNTLQNTIQLSKNHYKQGGGCGSPPAAYLHVSTAEGCARSAASASLIHASLLITTPKP